MINRTGEEIEGSNKAPLWLPSVEKRADEEIAALDREAERRLATHPRPTQAEQEQAARSAARHKALFKEQNKGLDDTNHRLSRAFEVFVALGLKGKPADARGAGGFTPGYFGRIAEVDLTSSEDDIHKGIDCVVRIPTGGKEYALGLDVTMSPLKLTDKFRKIRDAIRAGDQNIRIVAGASNAPVRSALMEWGRDENRHEAYDSTVIGARIREQTIAQLEAFEAYARTFSSNEHLKLAESFKTIRETLLKWKSNEKIPGLENDLVHQELMRRAREFGKE